MPTSTRARRHPALVLLAVLAGALALVMASLSTPTQAATPAQAAAKAKMAKAATKGDRTARAQAALKAAQKTFAEATPADERANPTMALRKLVLLRDALPAEERAAADKLLQRPSKPATLGDENILMHYDPAEVGYDVNVAFQQMQYVANTYANSGYRRPLPDKGKGGDSRVDIYLDQLDPGLYGYCTTDQKVRPPKFDVWAYCVIDADMAGFQRTPLENFQVTAAHEYFHATQYAYDLQEDPWLLEATAAWAEDQLYDSVNDNYQYLSKSPITLPGRPIDKFEDGGTYHYGVWVFFRYLTEKYPTLVGAMPKLVLDIWNYADSSKGPRKDLYSTQAIDKALKKTVGSKMSNEFALFSAANRFTHQVYSEGVELNYPNKPLAGQAVLAGGAKKSFKSKLDHLSSATYNFVNGGGASTLKLQFRMAPKRAGSLAVVVSYGPAGNVIGIQTVKVNRKGKGKEKVGFTPATSSVDVTLVNSSTKYKKCYQFSRNPVACYGKPVFDNQKQKVTGKAA